MDLKEIKRLEKMSLFEQRLRKKGFKAIAGVDEAGRGPLAGPVVAAACILPANLYIEHLNDSKKVTKERREKIFSELTSRLDVFYAVAIVDVMRIDEINILRASLEAMQIAVNNLKKKPDFVLFDGNFAPKIDIAHKAIIKGDSLSISIAAASVIAKYTRDKIMEDLDKKYPAYGFINHKGYGTKKHREVLENIGPCAIHRKTFEPIKSFLEKNKISV